MYAILSDGSLKWETKELAALIYAGLVLTKDGKLYIGTQAAIDGSRQLLTIEASNGSVTMSPSDQIMSAFSFGPDDRVYFGTVAGNICTIETNGPASVIFIVDHALCSLSKPAIESQKVFISCTLFHFLF